MNLEESTSHQDSIVWSKRILWPTPLEGSVDTVHKTRDNTYNMDYDPIPIIRTFKQFTFRTFEYPLRWYFLVFAPFNKAYQKNFTWFHDTNGLAACRKKIYKDSEAYFITKEINANKTHINALVLTTARLDLLNEKNMLSKYKIWAAECIDAPQSLSYITKEFKSREPILFKDYYYKLPVNNTVGSKSIPYSPLKTDSTGCPLFPDTTRHSINPDIGSIARNNFIENMTLT